MSLIASSTIEEKLEELGWVLPSPMQVPEGVKLPFPFIKVHGSMAYISGHLPLEQDGQVGLIRGKLGDTVSIEQGYESARLVGLAILSSLKEVVGSLDNVKSWVRIFGMVNATKNFESHPQVINGFSDMIYKLYGPERGYPSRSAVGMGSLPFQVPVEIEGVVEIA